jgi:hypothetical protein
MAKDYFEEKVGLIKIINLTIQQSNHLMRNQKAQCMKASRKNFNKALLSDIFSAALQNCRRAQRYTLYE